jgi:hypothetical protein
MERRIVQVQSQRERSIGMKTQRRKSTSEESSKMTSIRREDTRTNRLTNTGEDGVTVMIPLLTRNEDAGTLLERDTRVIEEVMVAKMILIFGVVNESSKSV